MLGTMLVVLGLAAAPGPAAATPEELIARLGSPRYAERQAAEAELARLGRLALPALGARREHRDLEVRSRVNALIGKIEGSLLLEPTPVVLDFQDRPLGEVVAAIAARADLPVALGPDAPKAQQVTLRADGPVPFWTAIDRLADVAGLGYAVAAPSPSSLRDHPLILSPSTPRPGGPTSDHGPFRVNLISLHYQRDLSFLGGAGLVPNRLGPMPAPMPVAANPQGSRAVNEQFSIRLQAAAEPRLALRQTGPPRLAAAVDELGQSLLPPAPSGPSANPGMGMTVVGQYGTGMTTGPLQLLVGLRRPESPGRTIRLLRGAIPVSVATRRPNPVVVALDGAGPKTGQNEDVSLVVNDGKLVAGPAGGPATLDLTITPNPARPTSPAPDPAPELDSFMQRTDVGPLQLELLDASGRLLTWYAAASDRIGDETRLSLVVHTGSAGGPTTLRYFGTIRATAEIPFEFRDVPMP